MLRKKFKASEKNVSFDILENTTSVAKVAAQRAQEEFNHIRKTTKRRFFLAAGQLKEMDWREILQGWIHPEFNDGT